VGRPLRRSGASHRGGCVLPPVARRVPGRAEGLFPLNACVPSAPRQPGWFDAYRCRFECDRLGSNRLSTRQGSPPFRRPSSRRLSSLVLRAGPDRGDRGASFCGGGSDGRARFACWARSRRSGDGGRRTLTLQLDECLREAGRGAVSLSRCVAVSLCRCVAESLCRCGRVAGGGGWSRAGLCPCTPGGGFALCTPSRATHPAPRQRTQGLRPLVLCTLLTRFVHCTRRIARPHAPWGPVSTCVSDCVRARRCTIVHPGR
jgi:hypothetical protein